MLRYIEDLNKKYNFCLCLYLGDIVDQGHPKIPIQLDRFVFQNILQ